ncbi:MAG: EAL domain-containing protein [Ideonella sp.]|nr:EAL domain-containing protein [Ideonella sp.]
MPAASSASGVPPGSPFRAVRSISRRASSRANHADRRRARSLSAAGIAPDLLEVEITESVMADPDRTHATLQRCTLGVHIAIDDFGTGYSSLAYLKRFQAQTLKIDRSFVSGLPLDRDDAAITQAVIALSPVSGCGVVAEASRRRPARLPRGLGCDSVQGYLTGRPMTETLLAARLPRPCRR